MNIRIKTLLIVVTLFVAQPVEPMQQAKENNLFTLNMDYWKTGWNAFTKGVASWHKQNSPQFLKTAFSFAQCNPIVSIGGGSLISLLGLGLYVKKSILPRFVLNPCGFNVNPSLKNIYCTSITKDLFGLDQNELVDQLRFHGKTKSEIDSFILEHTKPVFGKSKEHFVHAPRAALFEGYFEAKMVQNLLADILSDTEITKDKNSQGSFTVKIFDPAHPEQYDVRWLQAQPENNGATFQIASTTNCLEGNGGSLDTMYKGHVQGEDAVIGCAGAAIKRHADTEGKGYDILQDGLGFSEKGTTPEQIDKLVSKKGLDQDSYKHIKVGIHDNVVVTCGDVTDPKDRRNQGWEQKTYSLQALPVLYNTDTNKIEKAQRVNQIFVSAYCRIDALKNESTKNSTNIELLSKQMLKAAYVGTLAAAAKLLKEGKTNNRKVYLTMPGGGAFRNPIEWIGEALESEEVKQLIQQHDLEVILLFYPDKKRYNPVRTLEGDITFLQKMVDLQCTINACGPYTIWKEYIEGYLAPAYKNMHNTLKNVIQSCYAKGLNNIFGETFQKQKN